MPPIKLNTASTGTINNTGLEILFGATNCRTSDQTAITEISLALCDAHPQQVRWSMDEAELNSLANNIAENGVVQPICVMKKQDGRYLILAGHRRCEAARRAGYDTIPAQVLPYDERRGNIIFNASNLGMRELRPSEKAFAYIELERNCINKNKTTAALAYLTGDNVRMIQRFKRLTHLVPELLEQVDSGSIPTAAGVELSYLTEKTQNNLLLAMLKHGAKKLSMAQAAALREKSCLNSEPLERSLVDMSLVQIEEILFKPKLQKSGMKVQTNSFVQLLPSGCNQREAEAYIRKALLFYEQNAK